MNPTHCILVAGISVTATASAVAQTRTSANYAITTEIADAGGGRAASASYTSDGGFGLVTGVSSAAGETAKHGYVGQLYDATALVLGAVSTNVNEAATRQLDPWLALDDASFLAVPRTLVVWSVLDGPIGSISTSGLATAENVFANELATVRGGYAGFADDLDLTVLNLGTDDFGSYSGDGLDDAWQVQYFGENNPLAGPALDPDGDGFLNSAEWLALTDPRSFASYLSLAQTWLGANLTLSCPSGQGRNYTLQWSSNLATGSWTTAQMLPGTGATLQWQFNTAGLTRRFYRVVPSLPP